MATTRPAAPECLGFLLRNVDWTFYQKLRADPAHDSYRMTYLDGELSVTSGLFPVEGMTLQNIDWASYANLRDDPDNDGLRMEYLDGILTIMSPQLRHDKRSRRLDKIITAVARAWRIPILPIGTTTLNLEGGAPGEGVAKEPDEAYYLGDEETRVADNETLDLMIDPPPSLAIEVDNTGSSAAALPAHARIGVPEFWIYRVRDHAIWFGGLVGERYEPIDRSLGLPRLTPSLVLQALDARLGGLEELAWLDWLDTWARTLPEPPAEAC